MRLIPGLRLWPAVAAGVIVAAWGGGQLLAAAPANAAPANAAPANAATAPSSHPVAVVGISGLRWSDVSASATPALWRIAEQGSVGSLVDYAVLPHTCPADGWLTLNAGARAMTPHTESRPCPALPAVVPQATAQAQGAPASARVPSMSALISSNAQYRYSPHWGLLASAAGQGGCVTAVGPGAALALATSTGYVGSYLPDVSGASRPVLARCPLTVVDLGTIWAPSGPGRATAVRAADHELGRISAELPAGTTLLVTAPGASDKPHLRLLEVSGTGFRSGMLDAASTRQSGMAVLTDLTPTVLRWRGLLVPPDAVGSQLTRAARGSLTATIRGLIGQDTTAQVWTSTHSPFFLAYALADAAVLGAIGLIFWGARQERRRLRGRLWRTAGVFAGAVPAGTFLASLVPWWLLSHPAAWLYGLAVAWTAVVGVVALSGPWRRDPLGPPGAVAAMTVAVIGLDVMTGSRLQMGTPFGLSVLEAGRFYGVGGEAVGIYAVCGMLAAAWLGVAAARQGSRRRAVLTVSSVALFAVVAVGWPGFGNKVGGTIAMVPGFLLLLMAVANIRISTWRVVLVLASGVALFAVFALIDHFAHGTGQSDTGAFAGSALHGQAGGLLHRKLHSMVGSLAVNTYSPMVPVVIAVLGLILLRPAWFAVKAIPHGSTSPGGRPPSTPREGHRGGGHSPSPGDPPGPPWPSTPRNGSVEPLLRVTLAVMWLVAVLGWFADDSGIIVPATALPLALPLAIAVVSAVPLTASEAAPDGEVPSRDAAGGGAAPAAGTSSTSPRQATR